jgi:WD40 repeat protein/tetratricopeptide (TPR) repeat protein
MYRAFISYSHAADARLAQAMRSALHRFAKPWYRLRAVRVFCDTTSLSANPGLWPAIEATLRESQWLLLVASPQSAESRWVQMEVDWWLAHRSPERMLVLLTDGEIHWDAAAVDFDWTRTTALPATLKGRIPEEPLYVDLRWTRQERTLSLRQPRFRAAVLDVAAPLHGRSKDELAGEDVRQHRITRAAVAAVIVVILGFAALASWQWRVAAQQRDEAIRQEAIAKREQATAERERDRAEAAAMAEREAKESEARQREEAERQRDAANDRLARLYVSNGLRASEEGDLTGALVWSIAALDRDRGNRDRERTHRTRVGTLLRHLPAPRALWFHAEPVNTVEFSADGRWIVVSTGRAYTRDAGAGEASIRDATTGRPRVPSLRHQGSVLAASFSPDGARVATASADGTARIWNAATGAPVGVPLGHRAAVRRVAWSPDSRRVATASGDATARVWDAASGAPVTPPLQHQRAVWHVAFSADGSRLVTTTVDPYGKFDGVARIWDATSGQPITPELKHGHAGSWVYSAALSPDGRWLATASSDGLARVWNAVSGAEAMSPFRHESRVSAVAFSPDGRWLLTGSWDGSARLWDLAPAAPGARATRPGDDQRLRARLAHGAAVKQAVFGPDGLRIATVSVDRTLRMWDATTGEPLGPALVHSASAYPSAGTPGDPGETPGPEVTAAFSPSGGRVVTGSWDGTVRVWDLPVSELTAPPLRSPYPWNLLRPGSLRPTAPSTVSGDGRWVGLIDGDDSLRIWNLRSARPVGRPVFHAEAVNAAAFSPDGLRLVTGTGANYAYRREGEARVWDVRTGAPVSATMRHETGIQHVAFSPDGRWIATAGWDDTARVWEAASGAPRAVLRHGGDVNHVAFDARSSRVVTASADRTARVWDRGSGAPIGAVLRHDHGVRHATFSPDGTLVATASGDHRSGIARVWSVGAGRERFPPLRFAEHLNRVIFSPDGARLATATSDGMARIWDVASGTPVTPPLAHGSGPGSLFKERSGVTAAEFSRDGRWLAAGAASGIARVWDAASGDPITPPLRHGSAIHEVRFSVDGLRLITTCVDGTVSTWDISPDARDVAHLGDVAALLSVRRLDASGTLMPLDLTQLREAWTRYRESGRPARERAQAWHQRETLAAETRGAWPAALHHLDRLITGSAPGWLPYAQRGSVHARARHWEHAAADYSRAIELGADVWKARLARGLVFAAQHEWSKAAPDFQAVVDLGVPDPRLALAAAPVFLAQGDLDRYRRASERLLERLGRDGEGQEDLLQRVGVLLLGPQPPPVLEQLPSVIATRFADDHPARRMLDGAVLFRAGRLDAAVERLGDGADRARASAVAWHSFFLAMARHVTGNEAGARAALDRGTRALDAAASERSPSSIVGLVSDDHHGNWRRRLELELLHREAVAALGTKGSAR